MFDSNRYLTLELLASILSEFTWPFEYFLEDDLPDGIILCFPKSSFYFREGVDGELTVGFLSKDTGGHEGLHIGHAMMASVPGSQYTLSSITPGLIENEWPFASEKKVKDGIRNACIVILTHLVPVINGDFSWVNKYLKLLEIEKKRLGPASSNF